MGFFVKIGANIKGYQTGLDKMRKETKAMTSNIKGMMAGALAGGGMIAGLSKIADELDRIGKLSTRFNEAPEAMQRMAHAANLAGTDIERLAKGLTEANKKAEEAISGNKRAAEAFDAMGINAAEFIGLGMEDQLGALADGFLEAEKKGRGFDAANQTMSGSFKELIPLLREGSEGIDKMGDEAVVASEHMVRKAEEINDKWTTIKQNVFGFFVGFAEKLMAMKPVFLGVATFFENAFLGVIEQITNQVLGLKDVFEALMAGDFKGAGDAFKRTQQQAFTLAADRGENIMNIPAGVMEELRSQDVAKRAAKKEADEKRQEAITTKGDAAKQSELEAEAKAKAEAEAKAAEDEAKRRKGIQGEIDKKEDDNAKDKETRESELQKMLDARDTSGTQPIVDSLQAVGGGSGGVYVAQDPVLAEAKRQSAILQKIADNNNQEAKDREALSALKDQL